MAVKDESIFHPTENLVLQRPRCHFRAGLDPPHWQLRSVIGSEKGHIIYFPAAGKRFLLKINTKTREFERFRTLQFVPTCLVSRNGWLCCGGEHGEFVAIRLDTPPANDEPDEPSASRPSSSSSSPVHGHGARPVSDEVQSPVRAAEAALRALIQPLHAFSQSFGKDRVNCITLWFPEEERARKCAYKRPVAVLSMNDKTVAFIPLKEGDSSAIDTVTYPDCVNRAVISPDGSVCAAICDDPYLYMHERTRNPVKAEGYEWAQKAKVHLKSQRLDDRSDSRGSFAACFSNTGRYLAVGTQYGIISIFDTVALLESGSDGLVTSFGSSRPGSDAGAVREMAFCPGPFDLLAWTEDRGRVGLADVRRGYVSRQIINLDKKDDFEHFDLDEKQQSPEPRSSLGNLESLRYPGRFTDGPSSASASGSTSNQPRTHTSTIAPDGPIDAPRSSTDASRDMENEIRRYNAPLSREETMVLDAMREMNRRRRESERALETLTSQGTSGASGSNGRGNRERSASLSRTNATVPESRLVRDILADTSPWRDFAPGSGPHRLRDRYWADTIWRRMVSPSRRTVRLGDVSSSSSGNGAAAGSSSNLVGGPPARLGQRTPWGDLEEPYSLIEESDSRRDRDILFRPGAGQYSSVARQLEERGLGYAGDLHSRRDETAGLSWSEDGRTLFVGTEDGIYELHVNVAERKLFPSMTMR